MKANLKVKVKEDGSYEYTIDNRILSYVFSVLFSLSAHCETKQKKVSGRKSGGRVMKVTRLAEYDFERAHTRNGGRVVRIMPRQLKKIKDGQEKSLDE